MGVPAFYRWLVDKYPKIVVNDHLNCVHPLEFDNLYLDMNNIIHPCFHPDHNTISPPTTFDQVFQNIYAYIDRLIRIVRPRKLLYLAIDGVAPRAKMNQQRSRRFRTAKDNEVADEEEKRLREEFERKGKKLLPKLESQVSDSNVITPGTEFMHQLSKALILYIHQKLKNDPLWSQLQVILSDATVPGEGEHKIISFIRSKRSIAGYDLNTRHCLYGLDADLIMLALATHELHFSILREDVLQVPEEVSISESTLVSNIQNAAENILIKSVEDKPKPYFDIAERELSSPLPPQKYQFLHIWILREYLELDMQIIDPPDKFEFDIERIVDDFIFICFFVGNDFLPHMPTLEIHENAIDLLMYVYKKKFKSIGGYLVDAQRVNDHNAGYINLKRVEKFILSVGCFEETIFKKRTEMRERKLRRIVSELISEADEADHDGFELSLMDSKDHETGNAQKNSSSSSDIEEMLKNTKALNEKLKLSIRHKSDMFKYGNLGCDKVKLGSVGWKQRYYKEKFAVEDPKEVESMRKEIVQKYTEGLCWVFLYYFSTIPSWNWYYPYYYGPFASDLRGLAGVKVEFQKDMPFRPFDQLMAVLPPKSAHALPRVFRELMTDSNSDIIEFYPSDFDVDVDGKRFLWQGICKLPFIEQEKLLSATKPLEQKVEEWEAKRNISSTDKLFIGASNSTEIEYRDYLRKHTEVEDGIMCFHFELPVVQTPVPRLLEGIELPEKTILESDIMETMLWHEYRGRPPITRAISVGVRKDKAVNEASTFRQAGQVGFESSGRRKGIPLSSYRPHNAMNQRHHNHFGNMNSTSTCPQSVDRGLQNMRISPHNANRSYDSAYNRDTQNCTVQQENTWRLVSHSRNAVSSQGSVGCTPQFRPHNANTHQFLGRGRGRVGRGRGRGRAGPRPQMYSHYP
ncbi:5'-3' exoribonuclease 3-like isoform X3 [Amaranthus tricolor]|uniref:5'-3' exoribonuclease 3-like isoform X2 n=1 Tax=Amaranthus tricolor TaxID=29722 RepID=UPI002585F091|nr:5'-3' exoribonuclease 3-like isoform X2 [Amaranthus tricolor]XP_057535018.1 5'-3' exoribonuclease 3-like isoform X3 [Amaranthus tricolor]